MFDFGVKVSRATVMLMFLMVTILFIGSFMNRMGNTFLRDNIDQILAIFALGFIISESRDSPIKFKKYYMLVMLAIAGTLSLFIIPPIFGLAVMPFIVTIAPFVSLLAYSTALVTMVIGRKRNK